jgi:hypothetical protein
MTDAQGYERNEHGSWVPSNNANSIAEEMKLSPTWFTCGVKSWTSWETDNYQSATADAWPSSVGEKHVRRVRLDLDTARRNFHTISEEGPSVITGGVNLEVYSTGSDAEEIGGQLRHWGEDQDEPDRNDILGTIIVRPPVMDRLLAALQKDERVSIGLQVKLYKTNISRSFDEDWMHQDFYVEKTTRMPIEAFSITSADTRTVAVSADSDAGREARITLDPVVVPFMTTDIRRRINWLLGLLAAIVILLLLRAV